MKKLILILGLVGCTKGWEDIQEERYDIYQHNRDVYTLDTVFVYPYIAWRDTVWRVEEKAKLDTIKPRWNKICDQSGQPTHLEFDYYLKNNKRIQ